MKCGKCQFQNPAGMNFCVECGAKLEIVCPNGEAPNSPEHKFRGACGYNLTSLTIEQRHPSTIQDRSPLTIWGVARRVGCEAMVAIFVPKRLSNKGGMKDEQHRKSIYDRSDDSSYLGGIRHRLVPRPPAFNNAYDGGGSHELRFSTGYRHEGLG